MSRGMRIGFDPKTLLASTGKYGFNGRATNTNTTGSATPSIIQQVNNQWPGQNALGDPQSTTETVTLPSAVTVGNSIVAFISSYNLGTTGGTVTLTDNLSHTYGSSLIQVDATTGNSNQSWYVFVLGRITTGGTMTLTAHYPLLEWQSMLVVEMAGLAASPVIATNGRVQDNTVTTTDSLTAGAIAGGANPGIVMAVCLNGTDANTATGGGVGAPSSGTGWTTLNAGYIDWNGEENSFVGPAACPIYKIFASNMGSVTPTWTPKKNAETYLSVGVALKSA